MKFTNKIKKELAFNLAIYCIGVAAISLFYKDNILLTSLIIVICLVFFRFYYRKYDSYFFITGAIIGTIGEIVFVHFNAWQYTNPTFLGIPIWLPPAWGFTLMVFRRIAEALAEANR